ncbi:phage portal protein [Streptomyces sp. CC224B]|uniref:phage portal protein n=1 Tax=Streptomyces sp. CC224B TaxID=3044571 RepID=UPI0024A812B3|nr:phage portal protein [Streptomyces sp. CC224B]
MPGVMSAAGQRVDANSALTVSAVFACVRLLSETICTLPVATYSRRGGVRREVKSPLWLDYPDAEPGGTGRIDLLSQTVLSLLLDGNAYLAVLWDGPNIVGLEVLDPARIEVHMVVVDGRRRKVFHASDYDDDGNEVALGWFTTREILHVPGMTLPGEYAGVSPISFARESIGLAMAAQTYGARFFAQGAIPGALIEVPGAMSEEGLVRAREAWRLANSGAENSHRVALLTEGAKFSKVSLSPDEAQFLETRQFQVPEVARIFGVPPHLIADASNSTSWGSGLAEQNQAFAMFSLRPWLERIEAALTRLLFAETADRQKFVKFSLDGIQRGAPTERMAMYSVGLQQGIYSIDEVRAWEDLEPLPDGAGDAHRVPLNLADVTDGAGSDTPVPPAPPHPPAGGGATDEEGDTSDDDGTPESDATG